jgi:hypothetical protein
MANPNTNPSPNEEIQPISPRGQVTTNEGNAEPPAVQLDAFSPRMTVPILAERVQATELIMTEAINKLSNNVATTAQMIAVVQQDNVAAINRVENALAELLHSSNSFGDRPQRSNQAPPSRHRFWPNERARNHPAHSWGEGPDDQNAIPRARPRSPPTRYTIVYDDEREYPQHTTQLDRQLMNAAELPAIFGSQSTDLPAFRKLHVAFDRYLGQLPGPIPFDRALLVL